jgi:glycosyltransferase involved in cell wall biosynthesis
MRPQVILDVQVLGSSMLNALSRTGVARVVDFLARGLMADPSIDLRFCNANGATLSVYCRRYLSEIIGINHPEMVGDAESERIVFLRKLLLLNLMTRSRIYPFPGISGRIAARLEPIYSRAKKLEYSKAQIFHTPYSPIPDDFVARDGESARFQTIHDLIPVLHPEWFETTGGNSTTPRFREQLKKLRPTDFVHCVSQSTRNDLLNAVPTLDPKRVFVALLAADPTTFHPNVGQQEIESVRKRYSIPQGKYLLSVCTLEPRKNIESAVKAFNRMIAQEHLKDLSLVLVGAKGWGTADIEKALGGASAGKIITTGYVPEKDLAPLYCGATAFVYPSRYEGFGLPALEAMACGVPVIASNTSSIPEVVGDAGLLVEPTDLDGLCQAMLNLVTDTALRDVTARRCLERSKLFSWPKFSAEIVAAYHRSLSDGKAV